jgi:hypothetical protein
MGKQNWFLSFFWGGLKKCAGMKFLRIKNADIKPKWGNVLTPCPFWFKKNYSLKIPLTGHRSADYRFQRFGVFEFQVTIRLDDDFFINFVLEKGFLWN